MNNADKCPACGASWLGGVVPIAVKEHYAPSHRWRRFLIQDWGGLDRTLICPDCLERFDAKTLELQDLYK